MQPISNYLDLDEIRARAKKAAMSSTTANSHTLSNRYNCPKCKDTEWIWEGWEPAKPCSCQNHKKHQRRLNAAMIPDEFKDANMDTYVMKTDMQCRMFDMTCSYLDNFDVIHNTGENSFGFIAKYGEQKVRRDNNHRKRDANHNSFGLGKTHLQVAAAKELIDLGYQVMIVSDVMLMDELAQARTMDDGSETFNRKLGQAIQYPVLVWDDIGKSNPSEFKRSMYFQIINERYKARRPIIYSSNEDIETLPDRIGDAAVSRLLGMSKKYLLATAGPDYRAMGA